MAKPVYDKLGIKEGMQTALYNVPFDYTSLVEHPPFSVKKSTMDELDFIHLFCNYTAQLEELFPIAKRRLCKTGMLWVSWPKGKSKLPKDLNENTIRDTGLAFGLVDVKVCSIDEDWSALKFVYRLKDR